MRCVGGKATLFLVLLAPAGTTAAEILFESHFERVTDGRVEGGQAPEGAPDPTAHLSPASALVCLYGFSGPTGRDTMRRRWSSTRQ